MRPTKLVSTQNVGLRKHINYNENTFHKQNITFNITAKRNLPSNADKKKYRLSYNFGLWAVNSKFDKSVTLHSDMLKM